MIQQFLLDRQRFSERALDQSGDSREGSPDIEDQLGGQREWFWSVPGVFRALAAPLSGHFVAAAPKVRDPHPQSLGYWAALQYLLLYRLGWARPDQGLRWWYDQGKPLDDPTLAFISEVWDTDGHLDSYLAWLLTRRPTFLDAEMRNAADWPAERAELSPKWRDWQDRSLSASERLSFTHFQGGSDPLHLTGHSGEGGKPDPGSTISVISHRDRRAVFLTATMDAWYFDLKSKAKKLPDLGDQHWKIDVFVRPVGFLGTYRRSTETGLWFASRHRYHSPGN